jgi:hypothetical protein
MGIFFPGNWPSEAFTLPAALLVLVLFWVLLLGLGATVLGFFWPLYGLKEARERAERQLKWPTDWLARSREDSAEHLDRVLVFMRKHIDSDMTPEQAAALTPEDMQSYDWDDHAWTVDSRALDVKHMHSTFEREQDAKETYNAALAEYDYEFLQTATFWSYRWRNFVRKDWRAGTVQILKAAAWFAVVLYAIGILGAIYFSWTNAAADAVGQDYTVVSANLWTDSVTIEQDGCHITIPVYVDSSTEYSITGKGKADLDMVIIRDGELVQPCLE